VNKAELVAALEGRLGSKKAASEALEAIVDTVTRAVARGEKVAISGFGSFEKTVRGARVGRNPRTGEKVKIRKTSVPRFKPGTAFKQYVSDPKTMPKAGAGPAATAVRTTSTATKATATKATATRTTATRAAATRTATKAAPAKAAATKTTTTRATAAKTATRTATKAPAKVAAKVPARATKVAAKAPAKAPAKTAAKAPATRAAGVRRAPAKKA
jgi:DNA-binding protein HU-beta